MNNVRLRVRLWRVKTMNEAHGTGLKTGRKQGPPSIIQM
jgi:hypothetical protein